MLQRQMRAAAIARLFCVSISRIRKRPNRPHTDVSASKNAAK
jgi:hypothetical protein